MLAPDKLAGLCSGWNGGSTDPSGLAPLVPDKYMNLPIVGGTFGTQTINYETFIAAKPDIIIDSTSDPLIPPRLMR